MAIRTCRRATVWLLVTSIAMWLGGPASASADETFFQIPLTELSVTEGELPRDLVSWRARFEGGDAVRPRVVLDGSASAYLHVPGEPPTVHMQRDNTSLVIRASQREQITGRMFLPQTAEGEARMRIVPFTVSADRADSEAREAFYRGMHAHYTRRANADIAGAAWFRHQQRAAMQALGEDADNVGQTELARGWANRRRDDNDLYAMFTGGRAVSENLQLDRLMPEAPDDDAEPVALADMEGITVEPYEFDLPEDADVTVDPLARLIPADQHAMFFSGFSSLLAITDQIRAHDALVLHLAEPRSVDLNLAERYERQLCLPPSALARTVGRQAIKSVAITGSDPYLPTGSDLAVLFEARSVKALRVFLTARQQSVANELPDTELRQGEVNGVSYQYVRTPGRRISSYLAVLGDTVIVSNSKHQLQRLARVHAGDAAPLVESEDYRFFRSRYKRADDEAGALLVVPDAAIRRWCGPRWRIGAARRLRAAAVLGELHARHIDKLVQGDVDAGPIHTTFDIPGGLGELRLTAEGVHSSKYGTLGFLTPIAELPIDEVKAGEAARYRQWRDGYQQNWNRMYDPIAMRVHITRAGLQSDLTVMPLIAGSEFRRFINLTRGARIDADEGDRHGNVLAHIAMALNRESRQVRMAENFASSMASQLGAAPLSWMGDTVAVYAEDTSFWSDLKQASTDERSRQQFLERHMNRLPVALRVEVRSAMKLAAFLTSLRAYVEQTVPGMVRWQSHKHAGRGYVQVRASEQAVADNPDMAHFVLYYAASGRGLIVTPNEALLKRALDRQNAKAPATAPATQADAEPERPANTSGEQAPWLGKHLCFQIDHKALNLLTTVFERPLRQAVQRRAWSNLPILNEWKTRFPELDPARLHERVWGQRLIDPQDSGYTWRKAHQTMSSGAYGHPGAPKQGPVLPPGLSGYDLANFGLTFEEDGLRARVNLHKRPAQTQPASSP